MADPKFANLPGIAYDQPDVYETPDIPDDNTSDYYEDAEAEAIERLHISSDESINKFKGKYLTGHVDYAHNDVRGGCWELAGNGEKESAVEKYRRIKCEMDELLNEIVEINGTRVTSKTDKDSYDAVSVAVNSAQKVLGSLKLENVLGTETVASASESEIKKLIAQVDNFSHKTNTNQVLSAAAPTNDVSQIQLAHTKRIAELEARLHRIEAIVGTQQPERLNRLASILDTNGTLLDSVQQISTKAALLQPSQLDQIETRIIALTNKINAIHEKLTRKKGVAGVGGDGGGGGNNDDAKVAALYDIAKKTEPMTKLLPNMLHRMKALESLHNQANNFNKTIGELESTQLALIATLNGNKAQLQKVQETFALNLESVNQEVGALENRLKAAEKK